MKFFSKHHRLSSVVIVNAKPIMSADRIGDVARLDDIDSVYEAESRARHLSASRKG
jgi:hypothetical protein